MTEPSKSHINRCGETARKAMFDPNADVSGDELQAALDVIAAFRSAHSYPLAKTRNGLMSMVATEGIDAAIGQRLKRVPRIVRKLHRTHGTSSGGTKLARLEDIGGVRIVVPDGRDLASLRRRIEKNWHHAFKRERDYVAAPKDIGYRAVHIVVERDERRIEVQLRTRGQQEWADAAEAADNRLGGRGVNLKDSIAPPAMLAYFAAAGDLIHRREYELDVPYEVVAAFESTREAVINQGFYQMPRTRRL